MTMTASATQCLMRLFEEDYSLEDYKSAVDEIPCAPRATRSPPCT